MEVASVIGLSPFAIKLDHLNAKGDKPELRFSNEKAELFPL